MSKGACRIAITITNHYNNRKVKDKKRLLQREKNLFGHCPVRATNLGYCLGEEQKGDVRDVQTPVVRRVAGYFQGRLVETSALEFEEDVVPEVEETAGERTTLGTSEVARLRTEQR